MRNREETTSDLKAIHRVHELAFNSSAEAQLVDLLRSRGVAAISLVAEDEGEIVGHILFSPVSIDPPARGWRALGLAPVGVVPDRQRQGIGKALINEGLQRGKERGFQLVVVLGDPAYYTKFGFRRALDFGLGNEYQADEHFMVIELTPGVLDSITGVVKYAAEFNEADC
jgi:putative acetyltransferase